MLKALCAGLAVTFALPALMAAHADPAMDLATAVAERPANEGRVGTMHFKLTNAAGKTRKRAALMVHSDTAQTERIGIYFTEPAMIADTAFMSFDHSAGEDENWLFLPATERVRRLPTSDRGDPFMGTDLSYGDVKDNFKFALDDWTFTRGPDTTHKDLPVATLEGTASSGSVADEMGYGSFVALIDPETRFPIHIEYTDPDGDPLKRVEVLEIEQIGGAWTAMAFTAENLQTGHRTEVTFTNMRYVPNLDDSVFDSASLAYGAPEIG